MFSCLLASLNDLYHYVRINFLTSFLPSPATTPPSTLSPERLQGTLATPRYCPFPSDTDSNPSNADMDPEAGNAMELPSSQIHHKGMFWVFLSLHGPFTTGSSLNLFN